MFKTLRTKRCGFTITEVVVATFVFAMATAGVLATISALREPAQMSQEEITAANIGQQILENLRLSVDAETWDTGALALGNVTLANIAINGVTYTPSYQVLPDPQGSGARKVILDVTW